MKITYCECRYLRVYKFSRIYGNGHFLVDYDSRFTRKKKEKEDSLGDHKVIFMVYIFLRILKKHELGENMYSAKISTFIYRQMKISTSISVNYNQTSCLSFIFHNFIITNLYTGRTLFESEIEHFV